MKLFRDLPQHLSASKAFVVALIALFLSGALMVLPARADTVTELQNKIEERNQQLAALEAEIAQYEAELTKVGADRKTLEAEIARLDLSRKKIATDIAVTENRIATTDLELEELGSAIDDKERRIGESISAIEKTLRTLSHIDDTTLVEHFLASASLADAWEEADQLTRVQSALNNEVHQLGAVRDALQEDYSDAAKKQGLLVSYKKELSGQKTILDQNRAQQDTVLTQTKNKESEYQTLLKEKQDARTALEAEIRSFEAQLKYTLDPSKIPAAGSGVLIFPLDSSFMNRCADRKSVFGNIYCITQYFGNTAFAQSGAYNGKGHNGIDFGSPESTKVVAALSGIVEATGDTDQIVVGSKVRVSYSQANVRSTPNGSIAGTQSSGRTGTVTEGPVSAGSYQWWKINFSSGTDGWVASVAINNLCYSYGRWVLVRHNNGLATLYGHLSLIGVSKGEAVATGGFLGYSGATGYATGPHLHFTVYVADQVQVIRFGEYTSSTNCPAAYIPVAPTEAYLNPMSYL